MRTPSLEFLHDLRSDALPTSGLDATFSDITWSQGTGCGQEVVIGYM